MKRNSMTVKCMSRISLIPSVFLCSILLGTFTVNASPATVVIVDPNISSAIVGETFIVNVTVVDVENLYGVEAVLSWNSTVLTLVSLEIQLGQQGGVLNAPVYIAENSVQESRYTISATSTSPASPFNGTGNIVRLNFSVLNVGTCELNLQTQLYDYPPPDRDPPLSLPIAHEDIDGLFQGLIPEFPGSLIFAAAVLLTLFSAVLSKHIFSKNNKPFRASDSSWRRHPREKLAQAGLMS